jgi:predicted ATPase/DNA-binding winged helix-turn-helix (wHTH) protein
VSIQRKPFEMLALLIERAGELVTREQLCERLWPDGTHVDFEAGLNTAVRKLRRALEETPEAPRFLETVAGHGYRFRGALEPDASAVGCVLAVSSDAQHADELAALVSPALALWRGELQSEETRALVAGFASEDDAVRCAVGLVERARSTGGIALRIGLTPGSGETSRAAALVLCEAAAHHETLANAALVAALASRDGLVLRDHEPVEAAGAAPLAVVSIEASDAPPAALLGRPPFVGRKAELARLDARLDEARNGRGGLVLLSGEPGIGKTRLVEEFSARARRGGAVVLGGRCKGVGPAPCQPLIDALETAGALRPASDGPGALVDAFASLARSAPVVLSLDDLHRADDATLDVVFRLSRAAAQSALLVIGTYRDAGLAPDHPLARLAASEGVRDSLALAGLDAGQLHLWLETIGPGRSTAITAESVHRATGGSPFFVRELLLEGGLAGLRRLFSAALPIWSTPLVGRDRERLEVAELFPEHRLVTLTGAGGCGKTRLAHAVAENLLERFADGVSWVELARLGSAEEVPSAVARACGAGDGSGVPTPAALARRLAGSERLLVLDNCEHLLGACAGLVEALLRGAPGVSVLATSREALGVAGESTWRVPSLSLPDPDADELDSIAESDAVSLFRGRARAARAEFRLDAGNAPLVSRICRRLDGIPLALELAAARVRTLSLGALADGLDDRFRLLGGGERGLLPRQRTLLASIEWSHDLLDEPERVLFRRLSVFEAPFDLDAAEAVAGDDELEALSVYTVLARLVEKSLVQREGDRYRLLESIRHFARERAKDAGELDELRDRHLACFERRATGWRLEHELASDDLLREIARQMPDLTAAAQWCASQGRAPVAILHALRDRWWAKETYGEVRSVCTRILACLQPGSPQWLDAAAPIAVILNEAAEYDVLRTLLPELRAALEGGAGEIGAGTRGFLELVTLVPGAQQGLSQAIAALRALAESAEKAGERKLEQIAKGNLATVFAFRGDAVSARSMLAALGPDGAATAFRYATPEIYVAAHEGDLATAKRRLADALASGEDVRLLVTAVVVGLWSADVELLERALARTEKLLEGDVFPIPFMRGQLHLVTGDVETAEAALVKAFDQGLLPTQKTSVAVQRAELRIALGDLAGATAVLEGIGPQRVRGLVRLPAAHLARLQGERSAAESSAQAALVSAVGRGSRMAATDVLELLALLAADRGELDLAALLVGATAAFRERSGYGWRPLHVRKSLDTLRPGLAPGKILEGEALSLEKAAGLARRER